MQGVNFGGKHSYWDWGLILSEAPVVSPPKPKEKLVDVPGADGSLDLTETLTGKVQYEMRDITCKFTMMHPRERWPEMYSDILNHLHGKTVEITLDNDQDWAYIGRAKVDKWEPGQAVANLTIKAKVAPYKVSRYDRERKVL